MQTSPEGTALTLSGTELQALHAAQQSLLEAAAPTPTEALRQCSLAVGRLLNIPNAAAGLWLDEAWHVGASTPAFGSSLLASLGTQPPGDFPAASASLLTVSVAAGRGRGLLCAAPEATYDASVDADAQARLDLLLPMLRACVERAAPPEGPLVAALGRLGEPIALYTAEGTAMCQSPAFRRLLRDDSEGARVQAEARQLSRQLCALSGKAARETATLTRIVGTQRSRYELHASHFPRHLLARPAALVHLHASRNRMPSKVRLRQRLGLTPREVEIALLVSEGLTSKEIAVRLCVSTNTVRRHGEKVLEKLGLHTRAGVALALMREG